ncbi:MAG: hypothetical protein KME19_03610 [Microcoleus vaginatus WJT46-NPBG5]|nr:hypothetical protein [Microcoleus vaginatus WJT46-NPBG5]
MPICSILKGGAGNTCGRASNTTGRRLEAAGWERSLKRYCSARPTQTLPQSHI